MSVKLPRYKSHKEVEALKLGKVVVVAEAPGVDAHAVLVPEATGFENIVVSMEYYSKHKPEAGGYYVRYADGYESWSPGAAFEAGYSGIAEAKKKAVAKKAAAAVAVSPDPVPDDPEHPEAKAAEASKAGKSSQKGAKLR